MNPQFPIQSSDPILLEKAIRIAREFAGQYLNDDIVGIVFLGAIVRGYFDHSADIDIAIFKKRGSAVSLASQFLKVEGLEVHCHLSDYEDEIDATWSMAKRWTFSQGQIYHDPDGKIAKLLAEKVPMKPEDRKWLMMWGLSMSEWYIYRLTQLWVERGNLVGAHHMVNEGMNFFMDMLFALNDQLVPDTKWKYYCAEKLEQLPPNFREGMQEVMTLHDFSVDELERRRRSFMKMWETMKPVIEQKVHLSYEEINQLV